MRFYLGGKRISQRELAEIVGNKKLQEMKAEAKEAHMQDPNTEISWWLGALGFLRVEIH